jgi:hypothetical protein
MVIGKGEFTSANKLGIQNGILLRRSRFMGELENSSKPRYLGWVPGAPTCNRDYSGGRDQENHSLK